MDEGRRDRRARWPNPLLVHGVSRALVGGGLCVRPRGGEAEAGSAGQGGWLISGGAFATDLCRDEINFFSGEMLAMRCGAAPLIEHHAPPYSPAPR